MHPVRPLIIDSGDAGSAAETMPGIACAWPWQARTGSRLMVGAGPRAAAMAVWARPGIGGLKASPGKERAAS